MRTIFIALISCVTFAACSQAPNTAQNNASPAPPATAKAAAYKTPEPVTISPNADSVYTDISEKACKEVKPDVNSHAIYEAECPGTAGYKVVLSATDHSTVVSFIDGKGSELLPAFRDALKTVSDFILGDKLEWRMDGKGADAKPKAVIVRVNQLPNAADPDDKGKTISFLAVIRLGEKGCITDMVPASADQNDRARAFADAKDRPCMPTHDEQNN